MTFHYSEQLKEYMEKKNKEYILVEVVTADTSDVEVTEIATRFVDKKMADHYIHEKHYRVEAGEVGQLLLPRYPIQYADIVELSLKSFLFIHLVTQKGMKI